MVAHSPITFGYGGTDYTATTGARDTMRSLAEGGFHNDQDFSLLVEIAQFGDAERPGEKDIVTVCVDADGIPCPADEAVGDRISARIQRVGRAGGGLSYELRTVTRG